MRSQTGAATVEHAAISLLVALLAVAVAIAALACGRRRGRAGARLDAGAQAALRGRRPRALLARSADARLRAAARRAVRALAPAAAHASRAGRRAAAPGRLPALPVDELRAAWPAAGPDRVEPPGHHVRLGRRPAPRPKGSPRFHTGSTAPR